MLKYFANLVQQIKYGLTEQNVRSFSQQYIKQSVQTVGLGSICANVWTILDYDKACTTLFYCYTKYPLNAVSIQEKHHVLTKLTATLYSRSNSSMSVADTPGWIMPQSI